MPYNIEYSNSYLKVIRNDINLSDGLINYHPHSQKYVLDLNHEGKLAGIEMLIFDDEFENLLHNKKYNCFMENTKNIITIGNFNNENLKIDFKNDNVECLVDSGEILRKIVYK